MLAVSKPYEMDKRLKTSPTLSWLLQEIEQAGFVFDVIEVKNLGCAGYYCAEKREVQVDGDRPSVIKDGSVVHEVRHVYQDVKGVLKDNKSESRRSNLLLMEADAVSFELTVAFEVRRVYPDLWHSYVSYNETYQRMCQIIQETDQEDNRSFRTGLCAHNVFIAYLNDDEFRQKYFESSFPRLKHGRKTSSVARSDRSLKKYLGLTPDL